MRSISINDLFPQFVRATFPRPRSHLSLSTVTLFTKPEIFFTFVSAVLAILKRNIAGKMSGLENYYVHACMCVKQVLRGLMNLRMCSVGSPCPGIPRLISVS